MPHRFNYSRVKGVKVYLELRATRMFVGKLDNLDDKYYFAYDKKYMNYKRALPLGPEFPLTKQYFESANIFPSFWDRVPSKDNPAYKSYCESFGIDPKESNLLILLATIGSKGPSSFIFIPDWRNSFSGKDLQKFRKDLGLATREFGARFGLAQSTVVLIENGRASGAEVLQLLEILYEFPEAANYYTTAHQMNMKKGMKKEHGISFKARDLRKFRKSLKLTTRDFATCFGMSQSTVVRIENGQSEGFEALRLLAILHKFPEAASYYIEKYGGAIHSKTKNKILMALHKQQIENLH